MKESFFLFAFAILVFIGVFAYNLCSIVPLKVFHVDVPAYHRLIGATRNTCAICH